MGGLDDALGFRLRLLDQAVTRSFARHMEPLEISPTLYSILVLVEANPECRQTELSQALNMHPPNLADRVSLLIDRGLLARQEDPSDRRANVLQLSATGYDFMIELRAAHEAHIAEVRAMLGDRTYSSLLKLIPASAG